LSPLTTLFFFGPTTGVAHAGADHRISCQDGRGEV
jgi:hypothetical protein